jgi:hypothetical protein
MALAEMAANPGFPESRVSRHLGHSHAKTHVVQFFRTAKMLRVIHLLGLNDLWNFF